MYIYTYTYFCGSVALHSIDVWRYTEYGKDCIKSVLFPEELPELLAGDKKPSVNIVKGLLVKVEREFFSRGFENIYC